ncbi:MAG: 2-amino-4-hydroxy-6-hydroxymethyldihydropteridine diphosphokinase [Bacteroidota bacterium]|nr:2-amino-4-hydroxy-6-hydroxymethyldihydropteridine diphosphokinase [Bacteroidota bacterium]
MNKAVISIGTNLGNREEHLKTALNRMQKHIGELCLKSSVYETEAWGFESEHAFLNMVIMIETELGPHELMKDLLMIEQEMGRQRQKKDSYSSRPIDLDILFYEALVLNDKELVIPHPRLHERNFVLVPAAEILPDHAHPVLNKSIRRLLLQSSDAQKVIKYS